MLSIGVLGFVVWAYIDGPLVMQNNEKFCYMLGLPVVCSER